jgi:CheY-like chemotaxis protein
MKKTILIVDFEQESCEKMRELLESEGFRLLVASDGSEALRLFESQVPDLVLTAALLPKLNGFELCKRITSGELGQTRPVIMYSAIYRAEKYRKVALAGCGALEFLDQPVPKWQLMKVIRSSFSEIPVGVGHGTGMNAPGSPGADRLLLTLDESSQIQAATEDPLGVEMLFEAAKPALASVPLPELDPPLPDDSSTGRPSSLDIDGSEIDAAVDACRLDLDDEIRQRDEQRAQRLERQLIDEGQNILEFEASLQRQATDAASAASEEGAQAFELDEIELGTAQAADNGTLENSEADPAKPSSGVSSIFSFAAKTRESRNWRLLGVLGALLVLAGLIFWLVSR